MSAQRVERKFAAGFMRKCDVTDARVALSAALQPSSGPIALRLHRGPIRAKMVLAYFAVVPFDRGLAVTYLAVAVAVLYVAMLVVTSSIALCKYAFSLFRTGPHVSPAERIGTNDPDNILILVHGTLARGAGWTLPNSEIYGRLVQAFGHNLMIYRHLWSGWNSLRARRIASQALEAKMVEMSKQFPKARFYLIGHSHGGNVILNSLTHSLISKVEGVVCLATPILIGRRRKLDAFPKVALAGVPIILVGWTLLAILGLLGISDSGMEGALGLISIAGGAAVGIGINKWASSLVVDKDLSFVPSGKVIFVRALGDEASATLSSAHLIGWAMDKVLSAPSKLVVRWYNRVGTARKFLTQHWHKTLVAFVLASTGFVWSISRPSPPDGLTLLTFFISGIVGGALIFVFTQGGLWVGGIVWLISAMFLLPMVLIIGLLGLLTVGWEMALTSTVMQVTAEATPPGSWTVQQVSSSPDGSMQHSAIYQDPDAIRIVVEWLRGRRPSGSVAPGPWARG